MTSVYKSVVNKLSLLLILIYCYLLKTGCKILTEIS